MKENHANNDFSFRELEEQLQKLKPAATPPELSSQLLQVVSSERSLYPYSLKKLFFRPSFIPWAAAALLALAFIGGHKLWVSSPREQIAETVSTIELSLPSLQDIKGQAIEVLKVSRLIASSYANQDAAISFFKSINKEQFAQLPSTKLPPTTWSVAPELPPLSPKQEAALRKADLVVEALAAGAPTIPTLALASTTFLPKTKNVE